jgi:hypothetical protein
MNIAKDHRAHCAVGCNISLYPLRQMAEKAGITFSDEEKELFF